MERTNPFVQGSAAEKYHLFRPQYHHLPMKKVGEYLNRPIGLALDVACGTGHSTLALSKISEKVMGCDPSEAMLRQAQRNYSFDFVNCNAENLNFPNGKFELVNISMGYHWVQQEKFLQEAHRILQNQGFLSIDNYGFLGKISEDKDQQKAHFDFFEKHLPPASRGFGHPKEEHIINAGFDFEAEFSYSHTVQLSDIDFINIIKTWSNFQSLEESRQQLVSGEMDKMYSQIFLGQSLPLEFGGKVVLLKKSPARTN